MKIGYSVRLKMIYIAKNTKSICQLIHYRAALYTNTASTWLLGLRLANRPPPLSHRPFPHTTSLLFNKSDASKARI